jgi:hypothetical protein
MRESVYVIEWIINSRGHDDCGGGVIGIAGIGFSLWE